MFATKTLLSHETLTEQRKQKRVELKAIRRVIDTPVAIEVSLGPEAAVYSGKFSVDGIATVHAGRRHLQAHLESDDDPIERLFKKAAKSSSPVDVFTSDFLLRDHTPGKLLGPSGYGRIEPVSRNWLVSKCANTGSKPSDNGKQMIYTFAVNELSISGPAFGNEVSAVRRVFEGSELSGEAHIASMRLLLKPLTKDAEHPEDEVVTATTIGTLDDTQELSLLHGLSFITGNRIGELLRDTFDVDGLQIAIRHRRGSGMSRGRNAPFHRFYGWISAQGMAQIFDGFTRLQRADFPIGIVVHHLTESNTNNLDIDAQHLTLAIHTAIEGWNRLFGIEHWVDDEVWPRIFEFLRYTVLRPVLKPLYSDLGNEIVSNLWSVGRYANRSTTSWRQRQLFQALDIDVKDTDSKRALEMRDELLHNGYFLRRFQDLSPEEQQQRLDDIARLRNLAHTVVLRLAGYVGECFDFLTHQPRPITAVSLPTHITSQSN